jgi:thioredoxin-like negative regulator of GroEL
MTLVAQGPLDRRHRLELHPEVAEVSAVEGGAVARVYDFWAVWCPPCNQMAAEVLEGPLPWPVERVDVDEASSWALKSRHHVGGYPTLVAVDAAGAEVARLVGYPGPEATRAWFAGLGKEAPLATLKGAALEGESAARAARRFAEAGDEEEARRLLAKAADGEDLRVARLLVAPTKEDAAWLVARAPAGEWLYAALEVDPGLLAAAAPKIAALPASGAADALFVVAEGDAAQKVALNVGALALLGAARTGEPEHDRSLVSAEVDALAAVGDLEAGLALLDEYVARYPAEFTWDFVAANRLHDAGREVEAEARARRALGKARGDQRLRVAMTLARAVAAQGRKAEAVAVLDTALAEQPAPDPALDVRTHRYRKQVAELRVAITGQGSDTAN